MSGWASDITQGLAFQEMMKPEPAVALAITNDELEVLVEWADSIEALDRLAPLMAVSIGRPIASAPALGPRTRALIARIRTAVQAAVSSEEGQ